MPEHELTASFLKPGLESQRQKLKHVGKSSVHALLLARWSPQSRKGTQQQWGGPQAAANPPCACGATRQGEPPNPARCAATTEWRLFCTNTIIKIFAWYYTEKYTQILPLLH